MQRKVAHWRLQRGASVLELVIVLALIGIFVLAVSADLSGAVRKRDFELFAREVTALMERCRWKAMNERRYAGIVFSERAGVYEATLHADGNGNGIRTSEVKDGTDPLIERPVQFIRCSSDIRAGILGAEIPQIPPKSGFILQPDDPIKFGSSNIASFSPMGDSSSGTLYLACISQKQMYAIVVYGATARLSVWRFSNYQWQTVGDR